jgi:DUF4097 and DUF4098 domain-containing protein YvlB
MKHHAGKIKICAVIAALLLAPIDLEAGEKQNFLARDLTNIEVHLAGGEVQVMAWNGDHVTIERQKKSLPISVDRGNLKIGAGDSEDSGLSDHLKILAPDNIHLSVTTKSAKVGIQGFQSRIQVLTVSGNVKVSSCSAPVEVETVSGEIEIGDIKGDVSLMTVSGTIRGRDIHAAFMETKSVNGSQFLEDISARQLRVRSHSGSVELDGVVPPDGFWESSTFDGSMRFGFDSNASLDLEAHSRSGQVRVDKGIEARERAGNYFRGRSGTGKTLVRLVTFEGDIDVRLDR